MYGRFGHLQGKQLKAGNLLDTLQQGVATLYPSMEIHTALTPVISIDVAGIGNGTSQPGFFTKLLKPTFILRGAAGGDLTVAPLGDPGDGTGGLILLVGTLVGLGFVLGRLSKR